MKCVPARASHAEEDVPGVLEEVRPLRVMHCLSVLWLATAAADSIFSKIRKLK